MSRMYSECRASAGSKYVRHGKDMMKECPLFYLCAGYSRSKLCIMHGPRKYQLELSIGNNHRGEKRRIKVCTQVNVWAFLYYSIICACIIWWNNITFRSYTFAKIPLTIGKYSCTTKAYLSVYPPGIWWANNIGINVAREIENCLKQ